MNEKLFTTGFVSLVVIAAVVSAVIGARTDSHPVQAKPTNLLQPNRPKDGAWSAPRVREDYDPFLPAHSVYIRIHRSARGDIAEWVSVERHAVGTQGYEPGQYVVTFGREGDGGQPNMAYALIDSLPEQLQVVSRVDSWLNELGPPGIVPPMRSASVLLTEAELERILGSENVEISFRRDPGQLSRFDVTLEPEMRAMLREAIHLGNRIDGGGRVNEP